MKLYARIWLAIAVTVVALTLVLGLIWQNYVHHVSEQLREQMREQTRDQLRELPRELEVRNRQGDVVGRAKPPPRRNEAELSVQMGQLGQMGTETVQRKRRFEITLNTGEQLDIELPHRLTRPGQLMRPVPPWYFSPWGFVALLGVIALAVALGAYPIVRRLTKRLETLQGGVERWGAGHLSERVAVQGNDEVAFLAQKFNHAAAQIEGLVTAHKSLLANTSHELRSPLTRIRMGLELLDTVSAQAEIKRNIAELDTLIEEILLASRLDAPNADIGMPETFDLMGLAAEECARTRADLNVKEDALGTFDIVGDPRLVRRLLRNLLENAQRYNQPERGDVTLTLASDDAAVVITVRDHGPGVSDGEHTRIFEPFYRAKNASERDGGVGLGLALVKSIAQRHGGSAVCVPTRGGGGCFVVRLSAP
jgi:two-component system, OmpR family, sensor kinase